MLCLLGPGGGQGLVLLFAVGLLLAGARRAASGHAPIPPRERGPVVTAIPSAGDDPEP